MEIQDQINIVLVDDHKLFRKGMAELLSTFSWCNIYFEACNGQEFVDKIALNPYPNIVLLDIKMPLMDGYETARWIKENHPEIKILALSMYDDDMAIIKMLGEGAKGYILKDTEPKELETAIRDIIQKGYYYPEYVTKVLVENLHSPGKQNDMPKLNEKEVEFLKNACTELTYKEIADIMCVSPRTVDGYREHLFEKLNVKNRVGLVLYAIKNGIFVIN